jgi:tetratricopeptide (TPR) repeat protein
MKASSLSLRLLALSCFLAPLIGGHLQLDNRPLAPGTWNLLGAIFLGSEGATLGHAILAVLICTAMAVAILTKQVIQLPQPKVAVLTMLFAAILLLSIVVSPYKVISLAAFSEWAIYCMMLFTVAACAGRTHGPRLLARSFFAGCLCVALVGIYEYVTQNDPSWRIFALWHHPNAAAGILVMGFLCGLGLGLSSSERSNAIATWLACGVIGSAVLLTQSKGGYLSTATGLLAMLLFVGAYCRGRSATLRVAYIVCVLPLMAGITLGLHKLESRALPPPAPASTAAATTTQTQPANNVAAAPLDRVLNASGSQEQSTGFRLNLWRGAKVLVSENPIGYGIGTYRFESAKPGITTQTQLAHNSYIQLAVEASPASTLLLVAVLCVCAFEMLRGSRMLPQPQNLLRSGVFAAVLASATHSLVDSDLYHMGIGLSFFALIGIGLQLGSDGIVPEFLPKPLRALGIGAGCLATLFLLYDGYVELSLANFYTEVAMRDAKAIDHATGLQSLAPYDPRVWLATSRISPESAASDLQKSIAYGPTDAAYATLARVEAQKGEIAAARTALLQALRMDPNNLHLLSDLLKLDAKSDPSEATKTAQRLVAVETTPYFATRAIPDLIPTETYLARIYLGQSEPDLKKKAELLRPAIEGLLGYATTTVPYMLKMYSVDPSLPFARPESAREALTSALSGGKQIQAVFARQGKAKDAQWAEQAQRTFSDALEALNKAAPPAR